MPLQPFREREDLEADLDRLQLQLSAITESASDLAGRFELQPLLERILRHATSLLGCESGSISLVNEAGGTYTKRVDFGVGCQEGETFPLEEGMTGTVVRERDTVTLRSYSMVEEGHIDADDPRLDCAVIGVPIQWDEEIIGACVIFSNDPARVFTAAEARLVELFASHAAIALANAELHAKSTAREREAAVAMERERAVREVHAAVGHSLNSLTALLLDARSSLTEQDPAWSAIEQAHEVTTDALVEARRAAMGLGPVSLQGRTLEEALEGELEWVHRVSGADTHMTVVGSPRPLSPDAAHQAFRIAQEALSNVVAHARATRVRIGLVYGTDSITLLVEDNGRGFDVRATRSFEGSLAVGRLGLHGMTSRAIQLGGDLEIESIPGWGTKLRAMIPDGITGNDALVRSPWRILIFHSQPLIVAGLVSLLREHEPSMQVTGDIDSIEELLETITHFSPDVLVLELAPLHQNLPKVVQKLRDVNANTAIVVYGENPTVAQIHMSKELGVRGYINQKSSKDTILRSIVAAGRGEALLDGKLFDYLTDSGINEAGTERLTARELEVRELVAQGMADKQIATALNISVKTVEKHVGSLLRKTGATNRTMLTSMGDSFP